LFDFQHDHVRYGAPWDIYSSPDGDRVLAVGNEGKQLNSKFLVVAHDAHTGRKLWISRHQESGRSDYLTASGISPDGQRLYLAGEGIFTLDETWNRIRASEIMLLDAHSGTKLWFDCLCSLESTANQARDLSVSPNGERVYLTAAEYTATPYPMPSIRATVTVAYDAMTGARLWLARTGLVHFVKAMAVSYDGANLVVTGEGATVGYDAVTGEELWAADFFDPHILAVSPTEPVVYIPHGDSISNHTLTALETGTGCPRWSIEVSGLDDGPHFIGDMTPSADGSKLYALQASERGGELATVAYDTSTGALLWKAIYRSPSGGGHRLSDIATDDGGDTVLVAASNRLAGERRNFDYVTLAYFQDPRRALSYLVNTLAETDLPNGLRRSLQAKLNAAFGALAHGIDANHAAATGPLRAFIHTVAAQAGKKIAGADAAALVATAEDAIRLIEER
jgi:outer membrane protein assembly factor BamB